MKRNLPVAFLLGVVLSLIFGSSWGFATPVEGTNPPGWSHGKKTGWQGENVPPGLAKKHEASQAETNEEKSGEEKKEAEGKEEQGKKHLKHAKHQAKTVVKKEEPASKTTAETQGKHKKKKSHVKKTLWPFGQKETKS